MLGGLLVHSRRALIVLASTIILANIVLLISSPPASSPHFIHALHDSLPSYQDIKTYTAFRRPPCPDHCPPDPFLRPGMLYWSLTGQINETRWLPFPTTSGSTDQWAYSGGSLEATEVPGEVSKAAAEQITAMLNREDRDLGEEAYGWMREKLVLFIGSSHDRNNIQQFCDETHGTYTSWGGHTGGFCRVASHNLTIAHWFLYGMVDDETIEWKPLEARPLSFERRIAEIMLPAMENDGLAAIPDLVIFGSLFWDESFLQTSDRITTNDGRADAHGFLYSEMDWYRGRVYQLIDHLRSLYGQDIPLMLRTRHMRLSATYRQWGVLTIQQLDEAARSVAHQVGVKLFTWGDRLEGYQEFYDGDQHFALGPSTYLFGDMTLFYLRRATSDGCWSCP